MKMNGDQWERPQKWFIWHEYCIANLMKPYDNLGTYQNVSYYKVVYNNDV